MTTIQTDAALNHAIIEFYDKLSSWEHAIVRDLGISLAHIHTLETLGFHGAMRMKELAEKIGVTTGTLTVQIEKLVSTGLVKRQPHASDRRSILVTLTDEGHRLFQQHSDHHSELTRELTADFSSAECQQLLALFQRMNQHF